MGRERERRGERNRGDERKRRVRKWREKRGARKVGIPSSISHQIVKRSRRQEGRRSKKWSYRRNKRGEEVKHLKYPSIKSAKQEDN